MFRVPRFAVQTRLRLCCSVDKSRSLSKSADVLGNFDKEEADGGAPPQTRITITTITTTSSSTRRPGRDPKRYAWLLGLIVPLLPFIAWGLVELTGLGRASGSSARCSSSASSRCSTSRSGWTPRNPPDSVIKWLEQDRYYRWCTYLFIPIQYAGLVFACWLWSQRRPLGRSRASASR